MVDLDGTAIDSFEQIASAASTVRKSMRLPDLPHSSLEETIGLSATLLFPEFHNDSDRLLKAVADFRSRLGSLTSVTKVFPGATDVLSTLKSKGWLIAIATNKPQNLAEQVVGGSAISNLVDIVCGSLGDDHKPKPDILLRCFQLSGASEGVMIGDRPEDMKASALAGTIGLGLALGKFSRMDLVDAGASYAFESWTEMGEKFDQFIPS